MRKRFWIGAAIILCLFLGGCGDSSVNTQNSGSGNSGSENSGSENSSGSISSESESPADNSGQSGLPEAILNNMTEDEGYYDIQLEEQKLSVSLSDGEYVLGAQYEGEEPVWLIADEEENVYSYKQGQGKELLLEGVSPNYACLSAQWWKLGEKYYVAVRKYLTVLNQDGEKEYEITIEDASRVYDICMTENGRVAVAYESEELFSTKLMELDLQTYELMDKEVMWEFYGLAGGTGDTIMLMDADGLYLYDLKNGDRVWYMKWGGSTYTPNGMGGIPRDFRLTEEGNVVLLAEHLPGNEWCKETLSRVAYEDIGKTLLVYRTTWISPTLKDLIAKFNSENGEYYVHIEARDPGTDPEDFITKTVVELGAGKGADILDVESVEDIYSLTEKGVLENLEPYLQASGINKDDYFAAAFRDWDMGEGCYGLSYALTLRTMYMKEEIAEDATSLETLLANMEQYEGDAIFNEQLDYWPEEVLHYFLYMSEDFYGMLDWEAGTCDFSGELWYSMLENAKRYGLDERKASYEVIAETMFGQHVRNFSLYDTIYRMEGMIPVGYPVEDTVMHAVTPENICMNAASKNKEGVWEFMEFLLQEQSQEKIAEMYIPALKSEYENVCQQELERPTKMYMPGYDEIVVEKEQVELFAQFLENARPFPMKTERVWVIIEEEVGAYFSGDKTIEQVSEIINNRVGIYMAENQ